MHNKRIVLIPYEVQSRDYKSRLILSFFLVQAGFKVIFGRKAELEYFTRCFSNSIYIGLQSTNTYLNFYKKVKSNNNKLILFDEEGLVTLSKKTYLNTKFSKKIAKICDIFFCWGEESFKFLLSNRKAFKEKLVVVGNLRFDVLKKKFDFLNKKNSDKIKKKFKKYILISCSFGNANHYDKRYEQTNFLKKNEYLTDKQSITNYEYYSNYNKIKFFENKVLIKFLAQKFKNINFIIRPHPSEKIESYNDLNRKYLNVHVSKEFSIVEWLKWAKLNIHYYCTTSLEASAMGIENLAYNSDFNNKYFRKTPYLFSHKINTLNEAEKFIKKILKKDIKKKNPKNVTNYIYNFYEKNSYSKITYEIKKLSNKLDDKEKKFQSNIDYLKKKLLSLKFILKNFGSYTDYKAPNLSHSQLRKDLQKFKTINNIKIKVSKFQKNVFEISS